MKEKYNKTLLILYDLYWLRFKKPGEQWYELTDYLRDQLRNDGWNIEYTRDDLIASSEYTKGKSISIKKLIDNIDNNS